MVENELSLLVVESYYHRYMGISLNIFQFNFKHRIPIFLFLWDMNLESAIWQVQMIWFFISISSQAAESIMKALEIENGITTCQLKSIPVPLY